MFLFQQLQRRHNLQYKAIRDDAMKIRGHTAEGLQSPSPISQSNNKSGDQEPVIHPESGNTLPGSNADPIARNQVTLPDPVSLSSTRIPENPISESTRSTENPVKAEPIVSEYVEQTSGLQNEDQAEQPEVAGKEATLVLLYKRMKEMEADVKEKDAKIKELEQRLAMACIVTSEEAGVNILPQNGIIMDRK